MQKRYDRNIRLFGKKGQETLRRTKVSVIGVGGLGTHVVQQLSHLGIGELSIVDSEVLDTSNLNRYVGTRPSDVGKRKVDIGARNIKKIDPDIKVNTVFDSLVCKSGFELTKQADYVFGCLDSEGARMILNELCLAYKRPYFDLASEIFPSSPPSYGGRVCFVSDNGGCLYCLGELDRSEASRELAGPAQLDERKAIYGVDLEHFEKAGPSIVSINGVIASLAVTEFMVEVTGLREANTLIKYYGDRGIVTNSNDNGKDDCYYCVKIRGQGDSADVDRYINSTSLIRPLILPSPHPRPPEVLT